MIENSVGPIREAEEGTIVKFASCAAEYALIGPNTITCQSDGSWSATPQCVKYGESLAAILCLFYISRLKRGSFSQGNDNELIII